MWRTPRDAAWAPWLRYARTCPAPLLLERVLLAPSSLENSTNADRLPVVRLRRLILPLLLPRPRPRPSSNSPAPPSPTPAPWDARLSPWAARLGLHNVAALLRALVDRTLVTFEASVLASFASPSPSPSSEAWSAFYVWLDREALPDCLAGLPLPLPAPERTADTILYTTALRRVLVATLFAQWLPPTRLADPLAPAAEDGAYLAALFGDTHLDLVAAAVRCGRDDDAFFLSWGGRGLTEFYPLPQRVCCFEELPDQTPLLLQADLTYDSGRNKKPHTRARALAHVFLCKQMNQICQLRHLVPTLVKNAKAFPQVNALLRLVLRASLLGNLPRAHGRPAYATRVRIVLGSTLGAGAASDACLYAFFARARHAVLFLMHEFFVATCEADGAVDAVFAAESVKWTDFKAVVRHGNAVLRGELGRQARADFWAPTDWTMLDRPKRPTPGLINIAHTVALTTYKKIKKGRADEVIYKRMISMETEILAAHPPGAVPATAARLAAPGIARALHVGAWAAARAATAPDASPRAREVIAVRWLQPLLTRAQLDTVRGWLYAYYVYDQPDNQYRKETRCFGSASLYAHSVVKLYFCLYGYYRREALFVRPVDDALRVLNVLRERLQLMPGDATPPELGRALLCESCGRWMTAGPKPAPLWVQCRHDLGLFRHEAARRPPPVGAGVEAYVVPLHELGVSSHMFDLRDCERYCYRAKQRKEVLLMHKERAERAIRLDALSEPAAGQLANGEEDASVSADAADAAPSLDAPDPLAIDLGSSFWRAIVAEAETHATALPTVIPVAGEQHRHMEIDIQELARMRVSTRAARADAQKARKEQRKATAATMGTISATVLAHGRTDCGTHPLVAVDLAGFWYQRKDVTYGLCVYCGDMTTVEHEKITNYGLSCMNHAHAEFSDDYVHSIAFAPDRAAALAAARAGPGAIQTRTLDAPVRCACCPLYQTRTLVHVYDGAYRLYAVPVCKVDLATLRTLAPVLQTGRAGASAVEPVFLPDFLRELTNARHRRRRLAPATSSSPPAAAVASPEEQPLDGPAHDPRRALTNNIPWLLARVRAHTRLEEVLAADSEARLFFGLVAAGYSDALQVPRFLANLLHRLEHTA